MYAPTDPFHEDKCGSPPSKQNYVSYLEVPMTSGLQCLDYGFVVSLTQSTCVPIQPPQQQGGQQLPYETMNPINIRYSRDSN